MRAREWDHLKHARNFGIDDVRLVLLAEYGTKAAMRAGEICAWESLTRSGFVLTNARPDRTADEREERIKAGLYEARRHRALSGMGKRGGTRAMVLRVTCPVHNVSMSPALLARWHRDCVPAD